ncbi:MAG: translation initiation factor IF-2, partial [Mesorhizobium sp.]
TKGTNLDKLLEAILLQAEILDLKANPDRTAEGVVIEAQLDKGRGPVATVLVQTGTLMPGDILVAGNEWGRVRALVNDRGGQIKEFPLVIKGDVQGSIEAINAALDKLGTDEVRARIVHAGAGGITESDVSLAETSGAAIIGFNVRANVQARAAAAAAGIEIRYYSIIYNLVDDVKAALSGLLSP